MRAVMFAAFLFTSDLLAQTDLEKIRSYRVKNESSIYNHFISFLQIPNVATDTINIRKNADFLVINKNLKDAFDEAKKYHKENSTLADGEAKAYQQLQPVFTGL